MESTVYITRNGLLEPLGQSQVFGYLRGLSTSYRITLITYEKADDIADIEAMCRNKAECDALGINWLPQRFRAQPKVIAPILSMVRMTWLLWRAVNRERAQLIHARSYIPAAVAMLVGCVTRVPFIFDMRALWPEELIAAERLRRGSLLHRAICCAEAACLKRAAAVVSLTHAAVAHLKRVHSRALDGQRIVVIPTCADLERFTPATTHRPYRVVGCLGTLLSGWFKTDWLAAFIEAASRKDARLKFELTTRDEPELVRAAMRLPAEALKRVNVDAARPTEVQNVIRGQIASVMFFTAGLSKLGSSPTRMAEVLGCGVPVVVNDGVGDVASIVRSYDVGVIAKGSSASEMGAAYDELIRLTQDPELPARCRRAAQEIFSLRTGTEAYRILYATLVEDRQRPQFKPRTVLQQSHT